MEKSQDYDAVVVGARCAGAATAMLLARAGARVLVVERDAPGTDTLSTHALMRGAAMQLTRWGLLDAVRAAGTPAVRHTTFGYGEERVEVAIKPAHGVDALLSPRRIVLDPILAEAAAAAGAEIRYRTALAGVLVGRRGGVGGARLTGPDGVERQVRARIVIGADGRRSSLARMVGAQNLDTGANATSVIYAYVPGIENRGNRWHYGPGVAAGVIPTNGGLHCVFTSVTPQRYAAEMRGNLAAGLGRVLAELDPGLAAQVAANGFASRPVGFAGAPGFMRRSHGPGWALVGDAGYFKDPITAHGITDALRDAESLARAVTAGGRGALAAYQETRDALSLPLFRVTDAIAGLPADLEHLRALHLELNAAMKVEQGWMAGDPAPARAA